MNTTTNQWFVYGLPENPTSPMYGLYELVTDRFFFVHHNLDTIKEVSLLFSSRYIFRLFEISTASNYAPNLIDNSVCINWTLGDKSNVKITRMFNLAEVHTPITSLVETNSPVPWNYENDHVYLMATCQLIENHMNVWRSRHYSALDKYKFHFINSIPNDPTPGTLPKLVEELRTIIYTEFDFTVAEPLINDIIIKAQYV